MSKTGNELTRKELKGPDRFQEAAGRVATWVSQNQKQIAAGVVAVVVALAIAVAIGSWSSHRDAQSGAELSKVIADIEGGIGSTPPPHASVPFFPSEEDRQHAIVAAAAEVRALHSSGAAVATAALTSGDARLRLAEWDQALSDYQVFLSQANKEDSLRFSALEGTARAYEGKGDLPQAIEAWERVGAAAAFYKDRAEIERARLLAKAGREGEAQKVLSGFDEAFKDSPLKAEAHALLTRLGGK